MILPGIGSMAGLGKSAPQLRGEVQPAINGSWETGDWSPDLAAHEAGDVLVVIVTSYRSTEDPDISVSSGWTVLEPSSNNGVYAAILRRTAVSSATTLTLTNNNNTAGDQPSNIGLVHSFACVDAHGAVDEERVGGGGRNPPPLSPDWGAENNLWIVANITTGTAPATPPAGFLNPVQSSAGSFCLSTAQMEADAETLDPGAFEGSGVVGDQNRTIAVRPE